MHLSFFNTSVYVTIFLSIVGALFLIQPISAQSVSDYLQSDYETYEAYLNAYEPEEYISLFESDISLQMDGSVIVEEHIVYEFGDAIDRHGIIRTIPYQYYSANDDNYSSLELTILSVSTTNTLANEYSTIDNYDSLDIRIGNPYVDVSGQQEYYITYQLEDVVNGFDSYDELYWNVTGTGWSVPINEVYVRVNLPVSSASSDQESACFTGALGSATTSCFHTVTNGNTYMYSAKSLGVYEGLTIVAGFTKNMVPAAQMAFIEVEPPQAWFFIDEEYYWPGEIRLMEGPHRILIEEESYNTIDEEIRITSDGSNQFIYIMERNIWYFALPAAAAVISMLLFCMWWNHLRKKGSFARYNKPAIVQYDAPEGIPAAYARAIQENNLDAQAIVAQIIQLAVDKYIKIERLEKKKDEDEYDYQFHKLKSYSADKQYSGKELQIEIMKKLFPGKKKTVKLSALGGKFGPSIPQMETDTFMHLHAKDIYSVRDAHDSKGHLYFFAIVLIIVSLLGIGFMIGTDSNYGPWSFLAILPAALLLLITTIRMHFYTATGLEIRAHIKGLRHYFTVAEKERLEFHNAPEHHQGHFEKLLPYAIALGVEEQWAEQFADELAEIEWVEGMSTNSYSDLLTDITALSTVAGSTLSTLPVVASSGGGYSGSGGSFSGPSGGSSSWSGGSGFSGGSSGGGFGGGGGSSW